MQGLAGFGQLIDARSPLPGTIAADCTSLRPGRLRIGYSPERAPAGDPLYARDGEVLVFSAPDVASYRCQPDLIEVAPCPGAAPDWITALLIATALPAALWMQGRFVLHAAGIVPNGSTRALAIAGPSGAGKSTLVRQLLDQGAHLLGDDSLALEVTGTGIVASGLPGGIHLPTGQGGERRFNPVAADRAVLAAPLGAIIVLGPRGDSLERLDLGKVAAVEQLIANQHRPRIPAALGRIGPVLAQAAAIAEQVPVSLWRRRDGQPGLSPEELQALLASI